MLENKPFSTLHWDFCFFFYKKEDPWISANKPIAVDCCLGPRYRFKFQPFRKHWATDQLLGFFFSFFLFKQWATFALDLNEQGPVCFS